MSNTGQYAGFWMRFVAVIIDGIILSILQNLIIIPILGAVGFSALASNGFDPSMMSEQDMMAALPAIISAASTAIMVSGIISILYYTLMESSKSQATLGKMALGLKVTNENGEPLSFAKCLIRQIGKYVSYFILLIGFIMAGFTAKKQALHDMMAGALVVKK
ncbi:MAG: RDD family protein [Cytophagales bacterium]|nr:RDD family protein [Cytophagales bacterium]